MDAQEARAVLGVGPRADPGEVRAAYRRLALKFHPDKGSRDGGRGFRAVREAYDALRGGCADRHNIDHGAGPRGSKRPKHAPASEPRRGPPEDVMAAAAYSGRHGAGGDGAVVTAEYGLAVGATSLADLGTTRRSRPFGARQTIEVDLLPARRREDAARDGQNLLRIAGQRAGLRGSGRCVSGGLLVRENGGAWMWVTRLEVTV